MFQLRRRFTITATIALACATSSVFAQPAWPSQPIKLVVGFPAGSSPDLMARTLADAAESVRISTCAMPGSTAGGRMTT